ncbi:hypothetical protein M0813_23552 [Anaeramoeba flamelloides]|uniref:Uncharacterized protein n=1 Tax=Anaeramoeba flamelloides TaxID=1746091 RepID=A0ABQ8Y9U9_9EUKA|nr:hypothetical protein M0813_23552 [Anaeramoeba flamelloides]
MNKLRVKLFENILSALRGRKKGYTYIEPGIDYVSAEKDHQNNKTKSRSLSGLQKKIRTIPELPKEDEGKLILQSNEGPKSFANAHKSIQDFAKIKQVPQRVFLRLTNYPPAITLFHLTLFIAPSPCLYVI